MGARPVSSPRRSASEEGARFPGSGSVSGLVSVIVPVFNRQDIVGRALDSILAQSYRPIEVLVVNDGSTDGTQQILDGYASRVPDLFTVLWQPNAGPAIARNRALRQARGEFIAFLDSDDVWLPSKLELQLPLLTPGVGLVYSAVQEIDSSGGVLRTVHCEKGMRGDIYRHLLVRNRMTGGTVVVTRSALEAVGAFDENLRAAENWDLWIRISRAFEVDYLDVPLLQYVYHEDRLSLDKPRMQEAAEAVLRKHFPERPSSSSLLVDSFNLAYANLYYRRGVSLFSEARYTEARQMFRRCWQLQPRYRDSEIRFVRTFLGKRMNWFLSSLKRIYFKAAKR